MKTLQEQIPIVTDLLKSEGFDEFADNLESFGSKYKIVICQRGFVYAGHTQLVGNYILIENAINLRRWGTNKGLGQLALEGIQSRTEADAVGTVRVHQMAVVGLLDCKEDLRATT